MMLVLLSGCSEKNSISQPLSQPEITPQTGLNQPPKYYFPDLELFQNQPTGYASVSHLVMLNLEPEPVEVLATAYFENQPPISFPLTARPNQSTETNSLQWPVPSNTHFGLILKCNRSLICQVTTGWNNTNNQYGPTATTLSPKGKRETARSSNAISNLASSWAIADGIILNAPSELWIKEDEWLMILNPGTEPAQISLHLPGKDQKSVPEITVPAQRLNRIQMSSLVVPNQNYGAQVKSSKPVAVQWLRHVYWYDSDELMACWSVPGVPVEKVDKQ